MISIRFFFRSRLKSAPGVVVVQAPQGVAEERVWRIHKENPEALYGVEVEI